MAGVEQEYAKLRQYQSRALDKRRERAWALSPKLRDLERQWSALQGKRGAAALKSDGELAGVEKELMDLGYEMRALLAEAGLPEDYLVLRYFCPKCKDYGAVDGRACSCMAQKLFDRRTAASNLISFEKENFESFDQNVFPPGKQRSGMLRLKEEALEYAMAFPDTPYLNLFFTGSPGLGKSFLLNCVGKRVLERGFSVLRITGNQFHRMLMDEVIGARNSSPLGRLEGCDLLIFDDLGCEPKTGTITENHFFGLLTERSAARRHTCVATNSTVDELTARYGERTLSRLLDKSATRAVAFSGVDVRLRTVT